MVAGADGREKGYHARGAKRLVRCGPPKPSRQSCQHLRRRDPDMSPTIFKYGPYRFFFFSREEDRMHVHVEWAAGEAKFWLEPEIALARSTGLDARVLRRLERLILLREDEIRDAWNRHFRG
jgi:hypothetical protein